MQTTMKMTLAASVFGATVALAGGMPTAYAAAFGPATANLSEVGSHPVVGSSTITFTDIPVAVFNTTGSLTPATGTGTVNGLLHYSQTVNAVVSNPITFFFTASDGSGHTFDFDSITAQTLSYSSSPNVTDISLYLLGTMDDPNLGETATSTSLSLTLINNNGGPFSFTADLSNPPTPAPPPAPPPALPEPISLSLLGVGLVGLGAARARRAKR